MMRASASGSTEITPSTGAGSMSRFHNATMVFEAVGQSGRPTLVLTLLIRNSL